MTGNDLYEYLKSPGVKLMGILNLTPDSFYDGGKYSEPQAALEKAPEIEKEGADIIDIGAESTRPGSLGIPEEQEIERLLPVLSSLKDKVKIPVSLDTCKPKVADFFLKRKLAQMVNDIRGLRDKGMAEVVRKYDVPVVMMHMFGEPRNMQQAYFYKNVVEDIKEFFRDRIKESGLKRIILDPGIGFGKSVEHNLEIIKRLREFKSLGFPVLIGLSRKSFIGKILDLEAKDRLEGSLGALALSVAAGVDIVRVHDVGPSLRTIEIAEAIENVAYKEIQV